MRKKSKYIPEEFKTYKVIVKNNGDMISKGGDYINRVIKKFRGIFIFAAIETYFYFKFKPRDLEMFFMIWGFVSLALLLYNIFNVKYDGPMISVGSSSQSSSQSMGAFLEKIYGTDKNKTRNGGGILDPINLLYLFFVIANVIGYIFVMPK